MRKILLGTIILFMAACQSEAEKTTETVVAGESTKTPPPVEFADQKYVDMGKKTLQQFASGDIDGWVSGFADNVILRWSSGDSMVGKTAIANYWKDRRKNAVESIETSNDIWLPVSVNQPQGPEAKGIWVLNWHQVKATYRNKESRTFWVHIDMHYNNDLKIDEIIQYVDRAPINEALAKKK